MVMIKVNLADTKAKLSEYLDRALAGEHIVICRHNEPVAELRPIARGHAGPRPIGPLPGRPTFDVIPAFFEPLPDAELDEWEGLPSSAHGSAKTSSVMRVAEDATRYRAERPRRKPRS